MKFQARKLTRVAFATLACLLAYLLTYFILSYLGSYRVSESGKIRYEKGEGLSFSDIGIWQPKGIWYQPDFVNVDGRIDSRGDFLGYLFSPLVRLDQAFIHKTKIIFMPSEDSNISFSQEVRKEMEKQSAQRKVPEGMPPFSKVKKNSSDDSWFPVILLGSAIIIIWLLAWSLYEDFDKKRIIKDLKARGCEFVKIEWSPFADGLLAHEKEHIYLVTYKNEKGRLKSCNCRTSFFSGVYWDPQSEEYLFEDISCLECGAEMHDKEKCPNCGWSYKN